MRAQRLLSAAARAAGRNHTFSAGVQQQRFFSHQSKTPAHEGATTQRQSVTIPKGLLLPHYAEQLDDANRSCLKPAAAAFLLFAIGEFIAPIGLSAALGMIIVPSVAITALQENAAETKKIQRLSLERINPTNPDASPSLHAKTGALLRGSNIQFKVNGDFLELHSDVTSLKAAHQPPQPQ